MCYVSKSLDAVYRLHVIPINQHTQFGHRGSSGHERKYFIFVVVDFFYFRHYTWEWWPTNDVNFLTQYIFGKILGFFAFSL